MVLTISIVVEKIAVIIIRTIVIASVMVVTLVSCARKDTTYAIITVSKSVPTTTIITDDAIFVDINVSSIRTIMRSITSKFCGTNAGRKVRLPRIMCKSLHIFGASMQECWFARVHALPAACTLHFNLVRLATPSDTYASRTQSQS